MTDGLRSESTCIYYYTNYDHFTKAINKDKDSKLSNMNYYSSATCVHSVCVHAQNKNLHELKEGCKTLLNLDVAVHQGLRTELMKEWNNLPNDLPGN